MALLCVVPGNAQAVPRNLKWWTLRTEHFEINYHEGVYSLAVRAAGILEKAYARLSSWFDWKIARRVQVVLSDETDSSNGSARVVPYNLITVFLAPPASDSTLNDASNWFKVLLVHELTHIFHMDQARGAPWLLNKILGKVVTPNAAEPVWLVEGTAVLSESALTDGGRLRNSIYHMMLRSSALAGDLPKPDTLSGTGTRWPGYTSAYLFGSGLMLDLAFWYGMGAVSEMAARYSSKLIPFSLNITLRESIGISWLDLYENWKRRVIDESRAAEQEVTRLGARQGRRITHRGFHVQWPRFDVTGKSLLFTARGIDDDSLLITRRGDGTEKILLRLKGRAGADFTPDGRGIVFCQRGIIRNDFNYNDLYYLDLKTGLQRRLTNGLRVERPDVSPNGKKIAVSLVKAGRRDVAVLDLETGALQVLTGRMDVQSCDAPRWSPDGRKIVFSTWRKDGARNITLMDVSSGKSEFLTAQRSQDIDPCFTPDGKAIIFSSDRSGIYQLYQYDIATGGLHGITRLIGGAFAPEPSPDGKNLVYVGYTDDGYDLFEIPLNGDLYEVEPEPSDRPILSDAGKEDVVISGPESYSPWHTMAPRAWVPVIVADSKRQELGMFLSGRDALGRLFWAADLNYTFGGTGWMGQATYVYSRLYPTFSLNAWYSHSNHAMGYLLRDGSYRPYEQHNFGGSLYMSLPVINYWSYHRLLLGFKVNAWIRKAERQTDFDPAELQPVYPKDRISSGIIFGYYYSNSRSYVLTPGPARGRRISARLSLHLPELGSDFRNAAADLRYTEYLPLSWRDHVLALNLALGMGIGDFGHTPYYSLGGMPDQDLFQALLIGERLPSAVLRGFEPGALSSNRFILLNLEHRFPLSFVERGLSTLPFYLGKVYGAVFLDAAEAGRGGFEPEDLKFGTGLEIRADTTLAYYLPFTFRLGFSHGWGYYGENRFYFGIGTPY